MTSHGTRSPRAASALGRFLPAVVVGALTGVAVAAGLQTAQWWAGTLRIGTQIAVAQPRPSGQVSPCLGGSTCLSPDDLPQRQQRFIALVTGERAQQGCRAVRLDRRLQRAAQSYADTIAVEGRPSHIDAEQRTPQDRAEAAGYHGRVQENLAIGVATPDEVMKLWLHRELDPSLHTRLTNCAAVAIGLGYSPKSAGDAYGPGIWVLVLGQPENG